MAGNNPAPLVDGFDDIPQTAGIGKYSKESIKKTALSLPCVKAAVAQGSKVMLRSKYTVNGKALPPKQNPGVVLETGMDNTMFSPTMVTVEVTGDLNSDGSQGPGKRVGFESSCGDGIGARRGMTTTMVDGISIPDANDNNNNPNTPNYTSATGGGGGGGGGGTGGGGGSGADAPGGTGGGNPLAADGDGSAPTGGGSGTPSGSNYGGGEGAAPAAEVTDTTAVTRKPGQQMTPAPIGQLHRMPVNEPAPLRQRPVPTNPVTNGKPVTNTNAVTKNTMVQIFIAVEAMTLLLT